MQAVIGASLVNQLQPAEKPYEVRDVRLKGLLLRVQPSGRMAYYAEYGRGKRISLGRADAMSPSVAREKAKQVIAEAYQGKDPLAARRMAKAHTLGSFIDELFLPWAAANIKTADATVARLKYEFGEFQKKRLAEITPWLVEKWRIGRLNRGIKATTVNRALDDLRSALSKAVTWELLEEHPLSSVKRLKVDTNMLVRYLNDVEEDRLRKALDKRQERIRCERERANEWRAERGRPLFPTLRGQAFADHLKPLILLSINCGLRRGELFSLTWDDVDIDRAVLAVRGTKAKSGRTRLLPLNAEALDVLVGWKEQRAQPLGLVFPGRDGGRLNNTRRAWLAVLEDAEIKNFRWHDMRHHFASRLVQSGADLNTVRELLGHSSYQMTLRYSHLAPEHRAAAVAKLVRR